MRIIAFVVVSIIIYVAFWLNLSIFFSIKFKQAATSALCVAVWLFFSIFYNMIINLVGKAISPRPWLAPTKSSVTRNSCSTYCVCPKHALQRGNHNTTDASVVAWSLTMEQVHGAIPAATTGTKFNGCLATTHGTDCRHRHLFRTLVWFFHEKGNQIPIMQEVCQRSVYVS